MSVKTRNNSIDIFRYIAAVLVIAHHTDVLADIHPLFSYLISQVLPRISVPFFFAISGYFYNAKLEKGTAECGGYLKRLATTYGLWSLIYYLSDLLEMGTLRVGEVLTSFLFFGSEYHFWFFPALILAVLVVTALYRVGWKKCLIPLGLGLYLIGCFGHAYYQVGTKIPVLSLFYEIENFRWISHVFLLGFPSFVCGILVQRTEGYWRKWKWTTVAAVTAAALFVLEVLALKLLNWPRTVTMTVGLYLFTYFLLVWLLCHPMPKAGKLASRCRVLANVAFYSHVLFITIFNWVNDGLFSGALTYTAKFVFVFVATLLLGLLFSYSRNKVVKMLAA